MNPMDFAKDQLVQLVTANLAWIAAGVAAIAAVGLLIGIVKKLAAAMLAASLNAGDAAARRIAEKPRGVAVGLAAFALAITGLWAWHTFTAPRIVEKPVIHTVTVPDEAAIAAVAEARGKYGDAESARSDAEAKAANAKTRANTLETRLTNTEKALKQAETQVAALAAQLRELSPPEGDEKALERLAKQIDTLHAAGVAEETASLNDPFSGFGGTAGFDIQPERFLGTDRYGRESWQPVPVSNPRAASYRTHREYIHKMLSLSGESTEFLRTFYHRSCSICEQNYRARLKIDEIYPRLAATRKLAAETKRAARSTLRQQERDIKRHYDESHARSVDDGHRSAIIGGIVDSNYDKQVYHNLLSIGRPVTMYYDKEFLGRKCRTCETNRQIDMKIEELRRDNADVLGQGG
jgi:hypothetical protein